MSRTSIRALWHYAKQDAWFLPCLYVGPIMVGFALVSLIFISEKRKFETRGVATKGVVTDVSFHPGRRGKSYYTVHYRYTPRNGGPLPGSSPVGSRGDRYAVGQSVVVEYLPEDPTQNRLRDPEAAGTSLGWILFWGCLGFGALACLGIVSGLVRATRRLRFLREGTPVVGRVIEKPVKRNIPGLPVEHRFRYAFTDLSGQETEAQSPPVPEETKDRWEAGAPVTVVCDRDKPNRYEPDVLGLRDAEKDPDS
jgi:hypothetical protein